MRVNNTLTVNDDILVGEYIKHKGDENTRIYFTDDRLRFQAGGIDFVGMHKKSSAPHLVTINNGSNNIDFQVKDNSNNTLVGSYCGMTATTDIGLTGIGKGALQNSSGGYNLSLIHI